MATCKPTAVTRSVLDADYRREGDLERWINYFTPRWEDEQMQPYTRKNLAKRLQDELPPRPALISSARHLHRHFLLLAALMFIHKRW